MWLKFVFTILVVATSQEVLCNDEVYNMLCSRIYFKHPQPKDFAFINILSAVYVKTKDVKNGFPIYRNERGGSYFYYNKPDNTFLFSSSPWSATYFGLSVSGKKSVIDYPTTRWKASVDNDTKPLGDVFASKYWKRASKTFGPYYATIEPRCVPESMTDCGSGNVTFTHILTNKSEVIHDPKINNFTPITNTYQEDRTIYKHDTNPRIFLFYHSGYWIIGPHVSTSSGYFAVKTTALKPEFIAEKWTIAVSGGGWAPINSSVQCRGSKDLDCPMNPCFLGGVCNRNSLNESLCTCRYGYKGDTCMDKMNEYELCNKTVQYDYLVINREIGAVTSESCGYRSSTVRVLTCYDYKNWGLDWYGYQCPTSPPTTTRKTTTKRPTFPPPTTRKTTTKRHWPSSPWSRWTPSPKPFNLDDNESLSIAIRVLFISIPILLPIFHYCFYSCYRQSKNKELTSIWSLCSFHAWIGVIFWFMYLVLYINLQWKNYGLRTLGDIVVAAIVFIIFGYIFVLIESWFSSVMGYLKTRFDVDDAETYIRSLIAECPTVMTTAQCYHWETRTRQVSYTDANGNTQHRTETYQEKVVTWTGCDVFIFNYWMDTSDVKAIPKISTDEIARVKLSKEISFANDETRQAFFNQQTKFIDDNRHHDTYIEYDTSYDIANFKEYIMSYDPKRGLPFWMNKYCFCLWTFLCLSWPYRWLLRWYTSKKYFNITKEISLTPIQASPQINQPSAPSAQVNIPPSMGGNLPPPPSYNDAMMHNAYPLEPVGKHYDGSIDNLNP